MSTGEMVQEKQSAVMDGLTATMRDALGALGRQSGAERAGDQEGVLPPPSGRRDAAG